MRSCSLDGCPNRHYGHGFCNKHYQRWKALGDPVAPRRTRWAPARRRFQENVVVRPNGCWEWTGTFSSSGYGLIGFQGRSIGAHVFSFWQVHGRFPAEGLEILHSCDNRWCVASQHLSEGTHAQNMADAYARERRTPTRILGTAQVSAKLDEERVRQIRASYAEGGLTYKELAQEHGVSIKVIFNVVKRKTWRHVS